MVWKSIISYLFIFLFYATMNSQNEIHYIPVPWTDVINIITNSEKIDPSLIQTSRHPALLSTRQYLQYILDTNSCPFVPAIHNNNHYHALLYDDGKKHSLDYNAFYDKLSSSFLHICSETPSEERKWSINTILLWILSDPDIADPLFGDQVEKEYLKRRDHVINSGHMSAVVHSNRRPGSVSTNCTNHQEKIDLFKVDGVPFVMYKLLQTYDAWFMRTPANISAFNWFFPSTSQKYIAHFAGYLEQRIKDDQQYIANLQEGEQAIDDIIMHFYEHYLKDAPTHCEIWLRELLTHDFGKAKQMLEGFVDRKSVAYNNYIKTLS